MNQISSDRGIGWKVIRLAIIVSVVLSMVAITAGPVAAQSSGSSDTAGFCDIQFIPSLVNSIFSIFVVGGVTIGLVTWVATSATESLPLPQKTKKQIKEHRNGAMASMGRLVLGPAIILALLSATSIGIPDCVSIFP